LFYFLRLLWNNIECFVFEWIFVNIETEARDEDDVLEIESIVVNLQEKEPIFLDKSTVNDMHFEDLFNASVHYFKHIFFKYEFIIYDVKYLCNRLRDNYGLILLICIFGSKFWPLGYF